MTLQTRGDNKSTKVHLKYKHTVEINFGVNDMCHSNKIITIYHSDGVGMTNVCNVIYNTEHHKKKQCAHIE